MKVNRPQNNGVHLDSINKGNYTLGKFSNYEILHDTRNVHQYKNTKVTPARSIAVSWIAHVPHTTSLN